MTSEHIDQHDLPRSRTAVLWLVWFAALFVAWLLLVDTFDWEELAVGAVGASLAATVAVAVHRRGYIRFQPRAAWLSYLPSLVWTVAVDCWVLAGALYRKAVLRQPVRGATIRVPFHYGGDDGRDGARRALVNASVSLTPNTFVIDIDPESDSLLVHQLVPRPLDRVLEREIRLARRERPWLVTRETRAGHGSPPASPPATAPIHPPDPPHDHGVKQ